MIFVAVKYDSRRGRREMRARRPARRRRTKPAKPRGAFGRWFFGATQYNLQLWKIHPGFRTVPVGGRAGPGARPRPRRRRKIAISLYFNGLLRKSRGKAGRKPTETRTKAGENQGRFEPRNRLPAGLGARTAPPRPGPGRWSGKVDASSRTRSTVAGSQLMGNSFQATKNPAGQAAARLRSHWYCRLWTDSNTDDPKCQAKNSHCVSRNGFPLSRE